MDKLNMLSQLLETSDNVSNDIISVLNEMDEYELRSIVYEMIVNEAEKNHVERQNNTAVATRARARAKQDASNSRFTASLLKGADKVNVAKPNSKDVRAMRTAGNDIAPPKTKDSGGETRRYSSDNIYATTDSPSTGAKFKATASDMATDTKYGVKNAVANARDAGENAAWRAVAAGDRFVDSAKEIGLGKTIENNAKAHRGKLAAGAAAGAYAAKIASQRKAWRKNGCKDIKNAAQKAKCINYLKSKKG
jgi:hypothetical protein